MRNLIRSGLLRMRCMILQTILVVLKMGTAVAVILCGALACDAYEAGGYGAMMMPAALIVALLLAFNMVNAAHDRVRDMAR